MRWPFLISVASAVVGTSTAVWGDLVGHNALVAIGANVAGGALIGVALFGFETIRLSSQNRHQRLLDARVKFVDFVIDELATAYLRLQTANANTAGMRAMQKDLATRQKVPRSIYQRFGDCWNDERRSAHTLLNLAEIKGHALVHRLRVTCANDAEGPQMEMNHLVVVVSIHIDALDPHNALEETGWPKLGDVDQAFRKLQARATQIVTGTQ